MKKSETAGELTNLFPEKANGKLAHAILEKINAFVCIIDVSRLKPVWINKFITQRLGYTLKELTNLTPDEFLSFFQPCIQQAIVESVGHMKTYTEQDKHSVLMVRSKDNRWIWVLAKIAAFENSSGMDHQYLLVTATEIDIVHLNAHLNKLSEVINGPHQSEPTKSLTDREKKILKLIVNGSTDKEIALSLSISIHTAKTHRKKIIHKLCLKNSRMLIRYAIENGLD
jgi:DNA-binding CsgD family transcriptional regulator